MAGAEKFRSYNKLRKFQNPPVALNSDSSILVMIIVQLEDFNIAAIQGKLIFFRYRSALMLLSEEHYLDVKLCHVDRTKNILGVAEKKELLYRGFI